MVDFDVERAVRIPHGVAELKAEFRHQLILCQSVTWLTALTDPLGPQ